MTNPSAIFPEPAQRTRAGSCVLVTLEGTRPTLVGNPGPGGPGRTWLRAASRSAWTATGWPCCWPCSTAMGVACADQDVFVNAVGGVRINEPAADLAVMLAITSSLRGKSLPKGFIAFGEVGLAGEVRPPRGQERLKEAAKLIHYRRGSQGHRPKRSPSPVRDHPCRGARWMKPSTSCGIG